MHDNVDRCRKLILGLIAGLLVAVANGVLAVTPVDVYEFTDEEQQSRYRGLIAEIRCPKCLNTNLAGSDAPIAQDLRRTVHRLLVIEGFSDQAIRDYLQQRYGDFVLYKPPLRPDTYLLWFTPPALVILGGWLILRLVRRARVIPVAPLSPEQQSRLHDLMGDD